MKKLLIKTTILVIIFTSFSIYAKRMAPPPVKPLIAGNIMYTAIHDDMGYVQAWDMSTKKLLWKIKIYRVFIKPLIEEDVQYVYIRDMKFVGKDILILNEKKDLYVLDTKSKKVKKAKDIDYQNPFGIETAYFSLSGYFNNNDRFIIKYFSMNKNTDQVRKEVQAVFTTGKLLDDLAVYLCYENGFDMPNYFFLYENMRKLVGDSGIKTEVKYDTTGYGTGIDVLFSKKNLMQIVKEHAAKNK